MAETTDIALSRRGSLPDDVDEQSQQQEPNEDPSMQLVDRESESKRARAGVLLGAALSQLPIWGFAMSYGVFQEYYTSNWTLSGSQSTTGIIGTTSNGVMYLSMPILFALFTRRWARWRRTAALAGAAIACLSFLLSSFSQDVWHLVITQGVLAALGCALMFSPTTLSLGEWFTTSNRAVAYGVTLSCKNIVGSACPFLLRVLIDKYGFRIALRIWAAVAAGTGILSILLIPTHPSKIPQGAYRPRKLPWHFLKHKTIWIYAVAIALQSCGYGIPQTYLNTYAHDVARVSETSATLLLTLFNIPGIASSSFFGYLSDNKHFTLSATTVTAISAICSALAALLLWGLTGKGSLGMLILFSLIFGFFAGGYSATWGGVINEMESEASSHNEAIDPGMVYGLLNGARGVGYVTGGFASVALLKVGLQGAGEAVGRFGYGTGYGPLIVFTGVSSIFGGWGLLWKGRRLLRVVRMS